MTLRIALDMDDVLADTGAAQRAWLRETYGHAFPRSALEGARLADVVPAEHAAALEARMHEGDFFADLPVMPGSREVVRALAGRYEVFVATAAMEYPGSFAAKFAWLATHFPFLPASHVVFCGDKSVVLADFLIDDHARHFARFAGQGVLFTAPHNAREERYPRVRDWEDVARAFLSPAGPPAYPRRRAAQRRV